MIESNVLLRLFIILSLIMWGWLFSRGIKNLPNIQEGAGVFALIWLGCIFTITILGLCIILGVIK
jgi:hypothetical protein